MVGLVAYMYLNIKGPLVFKYKEHIRYMYLNMNEIIMYLNIKGHVFKYEWNNYAFRYLKNIISI